MKQSKKEKWFFVCVGLIWVFLLVVSIYNIGEQKGYKKGYRAGVRYGADMGERFGYTRIQHLYCYEQNILYPFNMNSTTFNKICKEMGWAGFEDYILEYTSPSYQRYEKTRGY